VWYSLLADAIVAIHVAYVGFVLVGQLAILIGLALKWQWIRNFWFRVLHLTAILIVGLEAAGGITCPLTAWENQARELAGQTVDQGSFIGRLLDKVLFYQGPPEYFEMGHIAFALLVLATFVLAPPRWSRRKTNAAGGSMLSKLLPTRARIPHR
jgi:hypothetical protein